MVKGFCLIRKLSQDLKEPDLPVAVHYLEEENLFVLLKVQGSVDVIWDSGQLFGVAEVEPEVCVAPNFITCRGAANNQKPELLRSSWEIQL